VFVSIEVTGQSVQFEQKFNYRRPMYQVLEHIWEIESHRKAIKVGNLNS
jgi:ubiquitin conjugation factor E4 A